MPGLDIAIFLVIVLSVFMVAWQLMPAGWLTAWTGTIGAVVIALHEAMSASMPELKTLVADEHRPWLVILFLLLTVAARFRNRTIAK